MLIEQAIFASGQTERSVGYQLLGQSRGIAAADARELAAWGPSHEALRETGPATVSINFHPLPSGAFCVSRSVAAGPEYSGRGQRVYTQCLVIAKSNLALFANNPFNVLQAAEAADALTVRDEVPQELEPLRFSAIGTTVDRQLLAQLAAQPGPTALGRFIEAALTQQRVAVLGHADAAQYFAGLLNCLPVACRTEFSFSTGLRFSPQRPFRVITVDSDPLEWQRLARQYSLKVVDLNDSGQTLGQAPQTGWGGFVAAILDSGKTSLLAAELAQPLPALGAAGLNDLGDRLRSKLLPDAAAPEPNPWENDGLAMPPDDPMHDALKSFCRLFSETMQRTDGAHPRFKLAEKEPEAATLSSQAASRCLPEQNPGMQVLLEHLDDVVFGAINGQASALAELELLWPAVTQALSPVQIEESREQYLRCALSICTDYLGESRRDAGQAIAALDVLCVLFEE